MKVYSVWFSHGEYSDHSTGVLAVFSKKEVADKLCNHFNAKRALYNKAYLEFFPKSYTHGHDIQNWIQLQREHNLKEKQRFMERLSQFENDNIEAYDSLVLSLSKTDSYYYPENLYDNYYVVEDEVINCDSELSANELEALIIK